MKVHRIVYSRQRPDEPCVTTCECSWSGTGATPEVTERQYREHRKRVGAPTRNIADNLGLAGSYFGTSATPVLR